VTPAREEKKGSLKSECGGSLTIKKTEGEDVGSVQVSLGKKKVVGAERSAKAGNSKKNKKKKKTKKKKKKMKGE